MQSEIQQNGGTSTGMLASTGEDGPARLRTRAQDPAIAALRNLQHAISEADRLDGPGGPPKAVISALLAADHAFVSTAATTWRGAMRKLGYALAQTSPEERGEHPTRYFVSAAEDLQRMSADTRGRPVRLRLKSRGRKL
ncbi:MAG TPA: hypothetical protein VEY95_02895 [Azospirillaceae bacterium]|nr:hypothetical protein [Azospirillaceae bacterium]